MKSHTLALLLSYTLSMVTGSSNDPASAATLGEERFQELQEPHGRVNRDLYEVETFIPDQEDCCTGVIEENEIISPTEAPTLTPTFYPTLAPTLAPIARATTEPPTPPPTLRPTPSPSLSPTLAPTLSPTLIGELPTRRYPTKSPHVRWDDDGHNDDDYDRVQSTTSHDTWHSTKSSKSSKGSKSAKSSKSGKGSKSGWRSGSAGNDNRDGHHEGADTGGLSKVSEMLYYAEVGNSAPSAAMTGYLFVVTAFAYGMMAY